MTVSEPDEVVLDDLPLDRPEDAGPADETPWKMLHPASLAVNLVPQLWLVVRQVWWLIPFIIFGGGGVRSADAVDLTLVGVFAGLAVFRTIGHFLTLRYRVAGGRLEIRSGLVQRNKRVISPAKVQNVELVRNVFHRMSGLVEVRIETASGDGIEGELSALTTEDAQTLVRALSTRRAQAEGEEPEQLPIVVENSVADLVKYGLTSTRFGAAALSLGVLFEVGASTDPERTARVWTGLGGAGVAAVLVAVVVGTWALGTLNAVVRHHGFKLRRDDERLVAEEGLLTRRRVELPLRKVQVVAVREPWLRRWLLGTSSVIVETAAARAGSGGTQRALSMVPVVDRHEVDRVVRYALPRADVRLEEVKLHPPERRALRRALVRGVVQGVVLVGAAVAAWFAWDSLWLLVLGVVLSPVPALVAWLDWRHQGWCITDEVVVSRRGYLHRSTTVVARDKLQSVELDQGPLQRRFRLGQVVLRVAGTSVPMPLLDHDVAFSMATRLSASVTRSPLPPGGAPPSDRAAPAPT